MNYSNVFIPEIDRFSVSPSANLAYDPEVTGFRFAQTSSSVSPLGPSYYSGTSKVLAANINRKAWFVQNLGTTTLHLYFSGAVPSGAPVSSTAIVLSPCTALFDGKGGSFFDNRPIYSGPVAISGSNPVFTAWQL